MAGQLPFERPLTELRHKIDELKHFTKEKGIDFSEEINRLEEKARRLEEEIYSNLTPWQRVQIARHPDRPTTLDYINLIFDTFVEIHGDRLYGDDPAIVAGIAKLDGQPVTIVGHQKGKDTKENIARNFGMPHPEGYRKALRAMEQAHKFSRPIICFIDTPGAYPGKAAEERGQSEAIARNLREMARFEVPIICVVTGEGGSGGALALGVGNHIYMLENAIYSVISPEGAAALLWKDAGLAKRAAETMKITAQDLYQLKIIDQIIPEPRGGAHHNMHEQAKRIKAFLLKGLEELNSLDGAALVEQRYEKYKAIGEYGFVTGSNS
ncbi:acetyl-CoA carboxylase carboxyl transferase subunit alpha [Caldalkalibacillus uzonensis]|uniref:Acetyl-coenzyme A carboxylase carboxyl transferase subunit alpha n=1 Tax=Caldalkalibacillus uzonensis TaxID=353224 RepID=A0ABU0CN65_9BACI|nr:acetyl-CoA carboxylase carboxyl transferase subunit alpha [Caldalkalibacillus uzonensis]MDQ0337858.1 acetyl-CoA carboxylase carboxyl transferase subunit alpha [Caldalkalibacillus uzonensis]